jgi:hypothetical protein
MQKKLFNKKLVALGTLPVVLSMLVAVSATAVAGLPIAKSAMPPHHTKPKAAPAPAKKDTPKSDSDSASTKVPDAKEKAAMAKEIDASVASATPIDPMTLMKEPGQYLNKKVTFTGTFNRFADIALDYKKAFRDSRDYVTFFILRPDVTDHTIPMAEMKLFFPRKRSTEVMDLETGDKIQIVGTEFSTALEEPWVDVEHIKIVQKTDKPEKKHQPEF